MDVKEIATSLGIEGDLVIAGAEDVVTPAGSASLTAGLIAITMLSAIVVV